MSTHSTHSKDRRQRRNRAIGTSTALACSVALFVIVATVKDYWAGFALYATLVALLLAVAIADHADARSGGSEGAPVGGDPAAPSHRLRLASRRAITPPKYLRLR